MSPHTPAGARLLDHVTTGLHDLRDDLAKRISESSHDIAASVDRLSQRVDEQGQRLAKVEATVDVLRSQGTGPAPNGRWKRDGALVLSGGGILAVVDALFGWIGTHLPK